MFSSQAHRQGFASASCILLIRSRLCLEAGTVFVPHFKNDVETQRGSIACPGTIPTNDGSWGLNPGQTLQICAPNVCISYSHMGPRKVLYGLILALVEAASGCGWPWPRAWGPVPWAAAPVGAPPAGSHLLERTPLTSHLTAAFELTFSRDRGSLGGCEPGLGQGLVWGQENDSPSRVVLLFIVSF